MARKWHRLRSLESPSFLAVVREGLVKSLNKLGTDPAWLEVEAADTALVEASKHNIYDAFIAWLEEDKRRPREHRESD